MENIKELTRRINHISYRKTRSIREKNRSRHSYIHGNKTDKDRCYSRMSKTRGELLNHTVDQKQGGREKPPKKTKQFPFHKCKARGGEK